MSQARRPKSRPNVETKVEPAKVAPPISDSLASRISDLSGKRQRASDFAHELAAMERTAHDWRDRESLAARRREVEIQASTFEHILLELQAGVSP